MTDSHEPATSSESPAPPETFESKRKRMADWAMRAEAEAALVREVSVTALYDPYEDPETGEMVKRTKVGRATIGRWKREDYETEKAGPQPATVLRYCEDLQLDWTEPFAIWGWPPPGGVAVPYVPEEGEDPAIVELKRRLAAPAGMVAPRRKSWLLGELRWALIRDATENGGRVPKVDDGGSLTG